MREFSHKLVTFFSNIVQDRPSQAQLKRDIDEIFRQIFEMDLKIQDFKQQGNYEHIFELEAAKKKSPKRHSTQGNSTAAEEDSREEEMLV